MRSKKQKAIFFFALAGCVLLLSDCKTKASLETARTAFKNKEYSTALSLYKGVYASPQNKEERVESSMKVAETYMLLDDAKNGEVWYKRIATTDPKNAEARLGLARALKANEKYNEAIVEYEWYKQHAGTSTQIEKELEGCVTAQKWKNQKTRYVVVNEKALNTEYAEYASAYGKKGVLYFTSDRVGPLNSDVYEYTGKMYSDIYTTTYKRNSKNPNEVKYDKISAVPGINTKFNDGVSTYDTRENMMIYTICNDKNGKGMKCKLYSSYFDGSTWTESELLPFCLDSFNSGQPSFAKDGTLYFSSDMPGGMGGKDLYKVTYNRKTKKWGEPKNLGAAVNTEMNEVFPFIHSNGTLYFSSDGFSGMGRLDVFYTKPVNGEWSTPVNMKSPINSGGDDFAFVLDETTEAGYVSSNREGGRGKDDIYRFYMTPLVFNLSGVVRDKETNQPVSNSTITMRGSKDSSGITIHTDDKGFYKTTLTSNADYALVAANPESYYLDSREESLTTKGFEASEDFTKDLYMEPLKIEDEFTLEGIYYDVDKADLRPESKPILDTLVNLLNKYPKIKIEIGSHTDCRSDSSYNQQLSARRAQSVVNYLIEKQIKPARLEATGYGESRLVNDCACEGTIVSRNCTEAEHQKNRRTTFRILSKDYLKK
jgi:peptidoglycan-associated lipoprotein